MFEKLYLIFLKVYLVFGMVYLIFGMVYLRAEIAGELFLLGGQGCYPADVS